MSAIERAQSEVETVQRIRRTRIGHKARVRDGLPHGGPRPYGLQYVRNHEGDTVRLAIHPEEAGAVRLIADRYLAGVGIASIADELNASTWRPRRAETWSRTAVRTILDNEIYAGRVTYNDLTVESDKVERIWDETTWRALRRERADRHIGGRDIATALSRLCYCGRCDQPMVHGHIYYRCDTHLRGYRTGVYCHANNTRETHIAQTLHQRLMPVLKDDVALEKLAPHPPATDHLEREREQLLQRIETITGQRKRLALALAEGTMDAGPYRAADDELIEALERTLGAVEAIDDQITARPTAEELSEALMALESHYAADYRWILREETKHRLNVALRTLGIRIICENCRVQSIAIL